jgi:predicted dehydrogenase
MPILSLSGGFMTSKNDVHCAIAGLGRIGVSLESDPLREKPASHMGAIDYNRTAQLVAGSDPDENKRIAFKSLLPDCAVYADTELMIEEIKPHILHIASITDSHIPILKMALSAGVPMVVCEKPLSNSLEEARDLLPLIDSSDSVVLVNHERRFSRDYREVRGLIRDKAFGELLSINARLYMGKTRPVSQILYHDGTHMLDILRFLTDENLEILHSEGEPYQKGGQLIVLARGGSVPIVLDVSGGRDHLVFELDLSFEKGRIRIGNGVYELWSSQESPYYTGFRSLSCTSSGWKGRTAYFSSMMNHAIELLNNPGRKCESSYRDGLKVLELIDEILGAYPQEQNQYSSLEKTPSSSVV